MRLLFPALLIFCLPAFSKSSLSELDKVLRKSPTGFKKPTSRHKSTVPIIANLGEDGISICSGVVIQGCILTAAHCLYEATKKNKPASIFQDGNEFEIDKTSVKIPEGYSKTNSSKDIAVAKILPTSKLKKLVSYDIDILQTSNPFTQSVITAKPLFPGGSFPYVFDIPEKNNIRVSIFGFGKALDYKNMKTLAFEKHEGMAILIGPIADFMKVEFSDFHSLIVTSPDPSWVVPGDSGGPVFYQTEYKKDGQEKILALNIAIAEDLLFRDSFLINVNGKRRSGINFHISIPYYFKWILEQLYSNGCISKTVLKKHL